MELKEIPISDLFISPKSTRTTNVTDKISDLVEHIKIHGILEPLIVFAVDDLSEEHELYQSRKEYKGKYEILSGQRRLAASGILDREFPGNGWDKIPCIVRDPPTGNIDATAISLGLKITNTQMSLEDTIHACSDLFSKYNDLNIVSSKTGISKYFIKKYVKFARLPQLVKDNLDSIHKNPKTSVTLAIEATDALAWSLDSGVPEQKVYDLAIKLGEMKKKSQQEYKNLRHAAEKHSEESLETIEDEANKTMNPKTYRIIVDGETSKSLEKLAEKNGSNPDDELSNLFEEFLELRSNAD